MLGTDLRKTKEKGTSCHSIIIYIILSLCRGPGHGLVGTRSRSRTSARCESRVRRNVKCIIYNIYKYYDYRYHNDYMIESRVRRNGLLCRAILYWKTPGKIYQDRLGTNVEAKG